MTERNIISGVVGKFDVREYSATLPREQRKIKGNDSSITFNVKYDGLPEQFKAFAKPFTTKEATTAYIVKFKVGANCRWYDKTKTQVARPDNTYLDGKRFELVINYSTLPADAANPMKASGYWANDIMYREVEQDPFAGVGAFEREKEEEQQAVAPAAPAQPTAPVDNSLGDDEVLF